MPFSAMNIFTTRGLGPMESYNFIVGFLLGLTGRRFATMAPYLTIEFLLGRGVPCWQD